MIIKVDRRKGDGQYDPISVGAGNGASAVTLGRISRRLKTRLKSCKDSNIRNNMNINCISFILIFIVFLFNFLIEVSAAGPSFGTALRVHQGPQLHSGRRRTSI